MAHCDPSQRKRGIQGVHSLFWSSLPVWTLACVKLSNQMFEFPEVDAGHIWSLGCLPPTLWGPSHLTRLGSWFSNGFGMVASCTSLGERRCAIPCCEEDWSYFINDWDFISRTILDKTVFFPMNYVLDHPLLRLSSWAVNISLDFNLAGNNSVFGNQFSFNFISFFLLSTSPG